MKNKFKNTVDYEQFSSNGLPSSLSKKEKQHR
jgi:hypothetical protein